MMMYTIKLIFYSLVIGIFLLSGVAFSADSTDETKDLNDQPLKNSAIQPTAKSKSHFIKKGGSSVDKESTKMPDDPFGKSKNEMTKRPPDPLERNNNKSLMIPGDTFNKTKNGMTKMPPDPLEKNNNDDPMMPDEHLN